MNMDIHSYSFCSIFVYYFSIIPTVSLLPQSIHISECDSWSEAFYCLKIVCVCKCVRACVIISSVWAFVWSAEVLIESDGLSVEAQCRTRHSCNCQVRRFHTATVLFNWKLTFPFFKRQPLAQDVSHPLSFHSVCQTQELSATHSELILMKHKRIFLCVSLSFCTRFLVWDFVFTQK